VAIGTAVIGGMLSATALAILFVPLFFVLIARRARPRAARPEPRDADSDARADEEEERVHGPGAAAREAGPA
jgi:hypothetical protein